MNEHEMCCGTVANKARLCAEIEQRDRVIEALERRIGELVQARDAAIAQNEKFRELLEYCSDFLTGTGLVESIAEACNETPSAALAEMKAQLQAEAFDSSVIETTMKAGCICEFSFTVRGAGVCPICHEDGFDRDCETCDGNGVVDLSVEVPWYIQKAIFKSMCRYKAASIRQRAQEAANAPNP